MTPIVKTENPVAPPAPPAADTSHICDFTINSVTCYKVLTGSNDTRKLTVKVKVKVT